jgi:hypothetical protein
MNEIEMDKNNLDIEIVKMTIKSLKSNTSCRVGGVPAELLKSGTEKLYGEEIPSDWKIGHISAIHKKERRTNLKITEELQY